MKKTVALEHWLTHKTKQGEVSYTNSKDLNNLLMARIMYARELVLAWDKENRRYDAEDVKIQLLEDWSMSKPVEVEPTPVVINDNHVEKPTKFFQFAKIYLDNMRDSGSYNVNSEQSKMKHFREYVASIEIQRIKKQNLNSAKKLRVHEVNTVDIAFEDITVAMLQSYKAYLKANIKIKKNGVLVPISDRTVVNHLITVRTIYNLASNSGAVDKNLYPFGRGKVVIKVPSSSKIGLAMDEIKILEAFAETIPAIDDYSFIKQRKVNNGLDQRLTALRKRNPNACLSEEDQARYDQILLWRRQYLKHAVNVWLVSFYFAGVRISDTLRLKWSDFRNGRLYYTMGKNNKPGSLKVPGKAQVILDQYQSDDAKHDLVFPELKVLESLADVYEVKKKIANADGRLNDALKIVANELGFVKPLKPHGSRHSFGEAAGENISVQMLQQLYRHESITTTVIYQNNFLHKKTDDALDAVLGN